MQLSDFYCHININLIWSQWCANPQLPSELLSAFLGSTYVYTLPDWAKQIKSERIRCFSQPVRVNIFEPNEIWQPACSCCPWK